jgi:aspartyl-tRNA(Asn)/glutamyl-tRNA(Gln) amidotransferase subunit C
MAKFTEKEILHLADLARLKLNDEDVKNYTKNLGSILDYVSVLDEVDVKDVEPTFQVTGLKNVFREDEVKKVCSRDELLNCSPLEISRDQIKVLPVFE